MSTGTEAAKTADTFFIQRKENAMNIFDVLAFALNAVMPIILLMALGYLLKKKGFINAAFLKSGNKIVYNVLLPVSLFSNIANMNDFSGIDWKIFLYVFVVMIVLFFISIIMALRVPDIRQRGVISQAVIRSSYSLVGLSLAQIIAGEAGTQFAALLSLLIIPLGTTLPVISLSIFLNNNNKIFTRDMLHKLLLDTVKNPLIRGVAFGLLVLLIRPFFSIFPDALLNACSQFTFINTVLQYLSKASTPVALLVLGGQFEFNKLSDLKHQICLGVIGRNVISPLVGLGGAVILNSLGLVHFTSAAFAALIGLYATSVAVASAIVAEEMDNDGQLAGQLVIWTTLASAVSLFVSILLLRILGCL